MNKKFLSAILFGAMLATSAGTFVSCKDYDDDIKNLQTQIDTNKTAIAELQKLVGAGNWVTNVAASGENLVVTMSNGTTATIAGIKGADGVDGKNAAEWTIGEDGFWYVDGEKTTNVAVAQNGKDGVNGLTAPSPSISANGNWVVYSWDETAGKFVAEETEIPAAGTSAYAVTANGVCTLYIADQNGEMQEIVLPATSDSFVIEAPAKLINVEYEVATWKVMTAAVKKTDAAKALLAKFPEIANIKKDDQVLQVGKLPLFVTPANVDLTDGFTFQLQDVKGKVADIELSNPVKGFGDMEFDSEGTLNSRSAEEVGMWSLDVTPVYDEEEGYPSIDGNASLIVKNAKGTAVRTAFAYILDQNDYSDEAAVVTVDNAANLPYAKSIDLFATFKDAGNVKHTPIKFEKEYNGKYVIELANELIAEEYGLSIAEDGHTLNIAKMPAAKKTLSVALNVYVLSLNGTPVTKSVVFTIGQDASVTETLAEKEVTLKVNADGSFTQNVLWAISEDMSATKLNEIVKTAGKTLVAKYIDEEGEEQEIEGTWAVYEEDGETVVTTTDSYKDAAFFGFVLDGAAYAPNDYTIRLTASTSTANVYVAEGTVTVANPEFETAPIKLIDAYVVDGVLQVVGTPAVIGNNNKIVYNLRDAFTANKKVVTGWNFVDVANEAYVEENGEGDANKNAKNMASENWIGNFTVNQQAVQGLVVNPYDEDGIKTSPATSKQVGTIRTIRAEYELFGNEANKGTLEFDVIVKSAVYSETPASVVTFTAGSLAVDVKNTDTTGKAPTNSLNLRSVTTAKLAYGPNVGTAYKLWNDDAVGATPKEQSYSFLDSFEAMDDKKTYVKGTDGLMISIEITDLSDFGYTAEQIMQIQKGTDEGKAIDTYLRYEIKGYSRIKSWEYIYNQIKDIKVTLSDGTLASILKTVATGDATDDKNEVVKKNGVPVTVFNETAYDAYIALDNANADKVKCLKLFKKYYDKISYSNKVTDKWSEGGSIAKGLSDYLTACAIVEAVDEDFALDFITISNTSTGSVITAKSNPTMTGDKVEIALNLIITDKWGMTMKVPFTFTVEDNRQ